MIDKKVYKTDYVSEFTQFFNKLTVENNSDSVDVVAEVEKYNRINKLRDNPEYPDSRNKLWTDF